MLTVQEVAETLGITPTSVYIAIREKRLPYEKLYGRKVIARSAVDAYLARTRADGQKPKGRPRGSKSQEAQQ